MASRRHLVEIVSSSVVFGLMSLFVRIAARHGFSLWEIVAWRMAIGTVGILPLVLKASPRPKEAPARDYPIFVATVLVVMSTILLYLWSLSLLPVGLATLIYALCPIVGLLFAARFLHESIGPMVSVGMVVAFLGIALTVTGVGAGLHFGIAVGLLAALFQGGSLPLMRQARKTWPAITIFFWAALGTTLACLPMAYRHFHSPAAAEIALLLSVGVAGLAAQLLMFRALGHVPASQAAVFLPVTPVTGLLLGAAFIGETLSVHTMVGAAITLSGVVLSMRATAAPAARTGLALGKEPA